MEGARKGRSVRGRDGTKILFLSLVRKRLRDEKEEEKRRRGREEEIWCGDDDNNKRRESPVGTAQYSSVRYSESSGGTLLLPPQSTKICTSPRNHSHHDWRGKSQAWSSATEYLPQMYLVR